MLRFFAVLTVPETADVLDVGARSVDRSWAFGRAWLYDRLQEDDESGDGERT